MNSGIVLYNLLTWSFMRFDKLSWSDPVAVSLSFITPEAGK
jgi:hypothetical protein